MRGKTKVEGLWKEDGSVVLVSGNHMFRVDHGLLAEQSKVFNEMLSHVQTLSADNELIEGVPAICIEDNWEDIRHFLRTILDQK